MTSKVYRYESIREFADAGLAGSTKYAKSHKVAGASQKVDSWSSNVAETIEEAHNYAVNGWRGGAQKMTAHLGDLTARVRDIMAEKPQWMPSMMGDLWDLAAYCEGVPEYAFEMIPEEAPSTSNTAVLLLGTAYAGGMTVEEVEFRGTLTLSIIEAFALSGIELEVWSETSVGAREPFGENLEYDSATILTCLKRAGDPVDVQSFSFATDPAWLRRLTFGVMEGWSAPERKAFGIKPNGGYGSVRSTQHDKFVGANMIMDIGQSGGWPDFISWKYNNDDPEFWEAAAQWVNDQVESVTGQKRIGGE